MSGVNQVTLIGHLGRDPEMRYTASGAAIANFSIATSETSKDREGNKQERTEWHKIVLFNRIAEVAGEYLRKGSLVYIDGRLQTRKWEDKDGQDRYTTEIVGNRMQLLGGGNRSDADESGHASRPRAESRSSTGGNGHQGYSASPNNDFPGDDDIPFLEKENNMTKQLLKRVIF